MSLNEMRLANILFESEDKYVHLVNEAVLNEAVEDVQGYIETLDMLKNGLVGHANIKTMIEELHDELSNVADEKSGRLNQIFGKRKKFATATENLKTQIWDLYKKLALSSPLKAQFEASKRKLASKQLAIEVEVGRTGAPAPTGASHPVTWSQINNWINAAFPSLSSADKQTLANALLAAEIAALTPGMILPERKITISSLLFEDSLPDLQPNDTDFSAKFKAEFEKQFAKFSPNLKNSLGNYQTKLDDYISTAKQRKLDDSDNLEDSKENKPTQDSGDDQSSKDETEQKKENDFGDANKGEDAGQQSNLGDEKTQYGGQGDKAKIQKTIDDFAGTIADFISQEHQKNEGNPAEISNKIFDFVHQNFDQLKRNNLTSFKDKESVLISKEALKKQINALKAYTWRDKENIKAAVPSLGQATSQDGGFFRKAVVASLQRKFGINKNANDYQKRNNGSENFDSSSGESSGQENNGSKNASGSLEQVNPAFEKVKDNTFNKMYSLLTGDSVGRRNFNEVKPVIDKMLEKLNKTFNKNLTFDDFMSYLESKGDVNDVIQKIKNNVANPDQVMSEDLRRLIIKEMYNLNLKRLFEDDFKFSKFDKDDDADEIDPETGYVAVKNTKSHKPASKNDFKLNPKASSKFSKSIPDDVLEESAGSPPIVSISPKKKFVNFKIEDFNDLEIEPVGSDLLIAYENTGADEEEYDFSALGIQGIDKISIPKDVDTFYIVGSDNSNKPAALPDRFSSESGSKTPDKTLNDLDTGLTKTKTTIDKSQSAINDLVAKKAGLTNIGSSGLQTDFAQLKMLQFTSNYKLL